MHCLLLVGCAAAVLHYTCRCWPSLSRACCLCLSARLLLSQFSSHCGCISLCVPAWLQMKDWLMEHGHEGDAWALAQKKGKKADFEALMRRVTGQQ